MAPGRQGRRERNTPSGLSANTPAAGALQGTTGDSRHVGQHAQMLHAEAVCDHATGGRQLTAARVELHSACAHSQRRAAATTSGCAQAHMLSSLGFGTAVDQRLSDRSTSSQANNGAALRALLRSNGELAASMLAMATVAPAHQGTATAFLDWRKLPGQQWQIR